MQEEMLPGSVGNGLWLVQVSPGEYLETALQPVKGVGRSVEAKNAVSFTPSAHALSPHAWHCWTSIA